MTVVAEHLSAGGSDCGCHIGVGTRATAGATGNFSWTQGSNVVFGVTFGILPAAGGGVVGPLLPGHLVGGGILAGRLI
jgi:hypothetical protein